MTMRALLVKCLRDSRYIGQEGLLSAAADEIDRLNSTLKEILQTSLDEWEFEKGQVRGKVHMIAQRALGEEQKR